MDADTISKHVSTHLARADLMELDAFDDFFAARTRALLDKISLRSARDFAREEWPPSGAVRLMS